LTRIVEVEHMRHVKTICNRNDLDNTFVVSMLSTIEYVVTDI